MKTAIRLAMALYPRWWRQRYGREMDALLEDADAGWLAVFDIVRGALLARIEGSMKRVSIGNWLGRNALGLAIWFVLALAFTLAAQATHSAGWFEWASSISRVGRILAPALAATIAYRLRTSFMMTLFATMAGFYGALSISLPLLGTASSDTRPFEPGRILFCIAGAALVWWAVRPLRRRLKVAS